MSMVGFTLTETLVVLALMAVFINISLSYGVETYERGLARTDRTLLIAGIREARADALSGICADGACIGPTSHGIEITPTHLTIFEGESFATRHSAQDEVVPFSSTEQPGGDTELVFLARSAYVASSTTLTLTGTDGRTETISVNTEGGIYAVLGSATSSTPQS